MSPGRAVFRGQNAAQVASAEAVGVLYGGARDRHRHAEGGCPYLVSRPNRGSGAGSDWSRDGEIERLTAPIEQPLARSRINGLLANILSKGIACSSCHNSRAVRMTISPMKGLKPARHPRDERRCCVRMTISPMKGLKHAIDGLLPGPS